jgi:hypothetical protein
MNWQDVALGTAGVIGTSSGLRPASAAICR